MWSLVHSKPPPGLRRLRFQNIRNSLRSTKTDARLLDPPTRSQNALVIQSTEAHRQPPLKDVPRRPQGLVIPALTRPSREILNGRVAPDSAAPRPFGGIFHIFPIHPALSAANPSISRATLGNHPHNFHGGRLAQQSASWCMLVGSGAGPSLSGSCENIFVTPLSWGRAPPVFPLDVLHQFPFFWRSASTTSALQGQAAISFKRTVFETGDSRIVIPASQTPSAQASGQARQYRILALPSGRGVGQPPHRF